MFKDAYSFEGNAHTFTWKEIRALMNSVVRS